MVASVAMADSWEPLKVERKLADAAETGAVVLVG